MDTFFDSEQRPFDTRSGSCDLPIFYTDASQFGVFFRVDLDLARDAMGRESSVEPWPIFGKAVAAIYAWEYRESTVGSYGEVGLGIQARRKGSSPSVIQLARDMGAQPDQGIWVLDLPVTTQAAHDAGVDLWGYPKYVTDIETRFEERRAEVALGSELRLSVGRLGGPLLAGQPVVTFSQKGGRMLRTRIDVDHRVRWGRGAHAQLELVGDGPTARSARRLGLDTARPVAAFRTDTFRARLPAGEDVFAATA